MHRALASLGTVCLACLLVAGCASQPRVATPVRPAAPALEFGPLYPAGSAMDPLVAATVTGIEAQKPGPAVTSAEIRGYLVHWVVRVPPAGGTRLVLASLKDGSLYTVPGGPHNFDNIPVPARLSPESSAEAEARLAVVTAASKAVETTNSVLSGPVIDNYLVRVHRADGSRVDVWVDPDVGHGRFFYDVPLTARP